MRDDDDAAAVFVRQRTQDPDEVLGVFAVQTAGGFVRQYDLAAGGQGAGDGHPLLLAAGERAGETAQVLLCTSFYTFLKFFRYTVGG